jgi:cysteinyl-tRNA synthetase
MVKQIFLINYHFDFFHFNIFTDKEFSDEKMTKAVNMLNSFLAYLKLSHSYATNEISRPRIELDETEVQARLEECRAGVHASLSDDFNTSGAVEQLFELVTFMNRIFTKSFDSKESSSTQDLNRHYGCVMSVANYVKSMLDLFGLSVQENESALVSEASSGLKVADLIDSSLRFRNAVRNLALSKEMADKLSKEVRSDILKHCDRFRNELREANLEFKDSKSETVWQIKK